MESAGHLVKANWPLLHSLGLGHMGMGDKALRQVVKGQWPLLERLDLSDNNLTEIPVVESTSGCLVRAVWYDFPTDTDHKPIGVVRSDRGYAVRLGVLAQPGEGARELWPNLKMVNVEPRRSFCCHCADMEHFSCFDCPYPSEADGHWHN